METMQLKCILGELDTNVSELKQRQTNLQLTPNFESLETLIDDHKELRGLTEEQEILEKIRPLLVQAIERTEQQEQASARQAKLAATSREIKKVTARLQKAKPCTVEQTAILMQLSKLKEEESKNA